MSYSIQMVTLGIALLGALVASECTSGEKGPDILPLLGTPRPTGVRPRFLIRSLVMSSSKEGRWQRQHPH